MEKFFCLEGRKQTVKLQNSPSISTGILVIQFT